MNQLSPEAADLLGQLVRANRGNNIKGLSPGRTPKSVLDELHRLKLIKPISRRAYEPTALAFIMNGVPVPLRVAQL
jgi:hypothetical protein